MNNINNNLPTYAKKKNLVTHAVTAQSPLKLYQQQ